VLGCILSLYMYNYWYDNTWQTERPKGNKRTQEYRYSGLTEQLQRLSRSLARYTTNNHISWKILGAHSGESCGMCRRVIGLTDFSKDRSAVIIRVKQAKNILSTVWPWIWSYNVSKRRLTIRQQTRRNIPQMLILHVSMQYVTAMIPT
jgi:hypothetical protein